MRCAVAILARSDDCRVHAVRDLVRHDDGDVGEAGGRQALMEFGAAECSCDAGNVTPRSARCSGSRWFVGDDVGDPESSARAEQPVGPP